MLKDGRVRTFFGNFLSNSSTSHFKHYSTDGHSGIQCQSQHRNRTIPYSMTTTQSNTYRQAQYSNAPFPLPIRVSLPLTQTGISGNTRIQHSAPLTALIFRLTATSADVSCLAVRRVDSSSRRPYVPSCSVVPFIEPP